MRVLSLCGQSRLPRRWENEFRWVIGCKGNSFCSVDAGASINTPNIGNSALIIEELD